MRTQEMREENIKRVLETAVLCLQQYGIEGTTQKMVAKNAGVTSRSLRNYFKTRDNCLLQAVVYLLDCQLTDVNEQIYLEDWAQHSGLDIVVHYFRAECAYFQTHFMEYMLINEIELYFIRKKVERQYIERHLKNLDENRAYLIRAMEKGMADGSIRKDIDPNLATFSLTNAFWSHMERLARILHANRNDVPELERLRIQEQLEFHCKVVVEFVRA